MNISRIGAKDLDKIKNGGLNDELDDELNGGLNKTQINVLALIRKYAGIKAKNISESLNMPIDTVDKIISFWVNKNLVERRGSKKSGGYWLVNDKKE